MTCYSVQSRAQMFVKGSGFLSFAKNRSRNIGKNISQPSNGKYSQKRPDHAKQSVIDAFNFKNSRGNG